MATIQSTDILFATLIQRGRTIASVRLSGITTFSEIIRYLRKVANGAVGMMTVSLRNGTQGWNHQRNIMFSRPMPAPVQLTLF